MASSNLKKQERRNWLDLPTDVTTNILSRIGVANILENAQLVCTAWHQICKDPVMYRVLNTNDLQYSRSISLENMCKQVVDRSQGQLVDVTLVDRFFDKFFLYVAERSSQLRRIEIATYNGSLSKDALMKFPLLEELNLYLIHISKEEIETIGRYCPMLRTLKLNQQVPRSGFSASDVTAIAIGQNLLELTHLELIANSITNVGLQVILDNCHRLETLDLRGCYNVDLKGDLGEKCCKQIKNLKLPNDYFYGCPYFLRILSDSSEDEDWYF